MLTRRIGMLAVAALALALAQPAVPADKPAKTPRAFIDGTGPGWKQLGEDDFVNVNCAKDTWVWKKDGSLYCKGLPIGVYRTKKQYTNFELVAEWRHQKSAGNSGIFVWASEEGLEGLKPNQLPRAGVEVQILDHGYAEQYEKRTGKKGTWFTTQGDVFPVGKSKMKPFPPTSPDGSRSFPRKNLTKGFGEWNHYYVRAINGEIRLWINGEEVSGGNNIEPRSGYLCLESEGSPIDFKNIKVRELP
jgi:hypothetical protein